MLNSSGKFQNFSFHPLEVYDEQLILHERSEELLPDELIMLLISFPNVLITAHQGFFTAEALEQIVSANGFTSESHYDSDDLPKGPHAEGGGEADAPQHCDGCGQFLGNPLTVDGLICVENMIGDYLRTRKVSGAAAEAVTEWADSYKDELDFRRIVLEALKG